MPKPDFTVDDHGTIFLVTPITTIAREWVEQHLFLEGWQWLGGGFAVEHRFVAGLVEGMVGDGLRVA
jgi:hypothetical protein